MVPRNMMRTIITEIFGSTSYNLFYWWSTTYRDKNRFRSRAFQRTKYFSFIPNVHLILFGYGYAFCIYLDPFVSTTPFSRSHPIIDCVCVCLCLIRTSNCSCTHKKGEKSGRIILKSRNHICRFHYGAFPSVKLYI